MFRILWIPAFLPLVCALLTCSAEADESPATRPAATQPAAEPTYTIGHTYRIGEKRRLSIETVHEMEREGMPDLPADRMKYAILIEMELEVGRAEKPDERAVTIRLRRMRMRMEGSDAGASHEVDTDRPETMPDGAQEAIGIIGVSVRAKLDSAGKIVSFEGVDEFLDKAGAPPPGEGREEITQEVTTWFRSFLDSPKVALPPGPVAVGAAWEVKDAPLLRDLIGGMATETPRRDVQCKLDRVEKGEKGLVAVISLRDAGVPDPGASGLQGEARYDLARQSFIEYSVEENKFDEQGVSKVQVITRLSPPLDGPAATRPAPETQPATAPAGQE